MINKDIQIAQVVPATAVIVPENRHTHMSLADKLAELDTARQKGLLSEEEYGISKKSVLRQFEEVSSAAPNEATVPKGDVMEREVVPTNVFHGQQQYARIMCPIAGHPGFDKGAYHHPVGLCCYTDDRADSNEDVCGQLICMPITTACYVGTLCYQPCGIFCEHKFPWLGDCPFSEQRVTAKFAREHPNRLSRREFNSLVLTPKGAANQAIFDRSQDLHNGQAVPLVLLSHSGMVITKHYASERTHGPWRYIESNCTEGGRHEAVTVRLEDSEFLKLTDCDLVLDVAYWKMDVGNIVHFVGGSGQGEHRTKLGGGGRSWGVNADGTISPKHHPHLVLGV